MKVWPQSVRRAEQTLRTVDTLLCKDRSELGVFSDGVATRIAAGAGYYGVMELSGNVWERVVNIGYSSGRNFEGRYHGNGQLASAGSADVTSWPGVDAVGAGFRGGSLVSNAAKL